LSGPKLATIAWRNLWRQKRRTILTLVSISFGGFMAVMMVGVQDRVFSDFVDTAARLGAGHVVVQHHEYIDTPSIGRTVTDTTSIHELAQRDPRVRRSVDRIMGQAMLSTARENFGAAFIAYDPKAEDENTFRFVEGVSSGELYETADSKGLVLGKVLAENLDVELGDRIVYTLMDKNGDLVAGIGRLSGTIGTASPGADASLFLLPINTAREVLGYDAHEATHAGVYLHDNRHSAAVAAALAPHMAAEHSALSWDAVSPDLMAFVAAKKGGGYFFLGVIAILITAGIFNTLFMSVMERIREFGILVAIGYAPRQIFRMVMWESVYLAAMGLLIAGALTYYPYAYLAEHGIDMSEVYAGQDVSIGGVGFNTHMPFGIYPESAAVIVFCILFATLSAGLYPAWKAGRTEPVDSIKLV
jgi:ABC-type lipoprotein release transport system permease subunit